MPFVVRDLRRRASWLVVVPFACYQAYNMYPFDNARGKNLYYGFDESGEQSSKLRASSVSFQRPYELTGMPREAERVHDFVVWAERQGYDMEYAVSADLNDGRVDPLNYKGLIFPGHDEYWSAGMRKSLVKAQDSGVSTVFLQANNVYWHIRYEGSTITCFKSRQDPVKTKRPGQTVMWRDLRLPEQELLGAQYVSLVKDDAPLVVANADHWFWQAAGVGEGEEFPGLVGGEADAVHEKYQKADGTEFTDPGPLPLHRRRRRRPASSRRSCTASPAARGSSTPARSSGRWRWAARASRTRGSRPRRRRCWRASPPGDGLASRSARRRAALTAAAEARGQPVGGVREGQAGREARGPQGEAHPQALMRPWEPRREQVDVCSGVMTTKPTRNVRLDPMTPDEYPAVAGEGRVGVRAGPGRGRTLGRGDGPAAGLGRHRGPAAAGPATPDHHLWVARDAGTEQRVGALWIEMRRAGIAPRRSSTTSTSKTISRAAATVARSWRRRPRPRARWAPRPWR